MIKYISDLFVGKVFICFCIGYILTFFIVLICLKAQKKPTPFATCFWTILVGMVVAALFSFFESFDEWAFFRAGVFGFTFSTIFSGLFFGRDTIFAQQVMGLLKTFFIPKIAEDLSSKLDDLES